MNDWNSLRAANPFGHGEFRVDREIDRALSQQPRHLGGRMIQHLQRHAGCLGHDGGCKGWHQQRSRNSRNR